MLFIMHSLYTRGILIFDISINHNLFVYKLLMKARAIAQSYNTLRNNRWPCLEGASTDDNNETMMSLVCA